ncbi:MAG: hypothetical protein ACKO96_48075 [Flammeovirgaceae bacterium]
MRSTILVFLAMIFLFGGNISSFSQVDSVKKYSDQKLFIFINSGFNMIFDSDKDGAKKNYELLAPHINFESYYKITNNFGFGGSFGYVNYSFDNEEYSIELRTNPSTAVPGIKPLQNTSQRLNQSFSVGAVLHYSLKKE